MAVEGHTDERGSSEYNLALGQRRAEAVVKSLTLLGVQAGPGRGGELRQGAPGGAGRERGGVGQESPRRADGRPVSVDARRRSRRRRDGARRAARWPLRRRTPASSTTTRRAGPSSTCASSSSRATSRRARARPSSWRLMNDSIGQLKRSLLDLNSQIELQRGDNARLRGQIEELTRSVAELQRKQTDIQQGVDDRIRKIEPQKVTVDDREFTVDPEEKRQYDEALAGFRRGEFERAAGGFTALLRRFPTSGYRDSALFWLGNAQYALREYKEAIASFRALVAAVAGEPARARGAARHRQLPGRAEGPKVARPQDDRRAGEDLSEVGGRAGRQGAAGVAAMSGAARRRLAGPALPARRRRRRRPRAPLRRPAPALRRRGLPADPRRADRGGRRRRRRLVDGGGAGAQRRRRAHADRSRPGGRVERQPPGAGARQHPRPGQGRGAARAHRRHPSRAAWCMRSRRSSSRATGPCCCRRRSMR